LGDKQNIARIEMNQRNQEGSKKLGEMFREFISEKYNTSGADALYSLDEAIQVVDFYTQTVKDDEKRAAGQSVMRGLKEYVERIENENPIVCPKCNGQTFKLRRMGEAGTLMECQTCKEQNWEQNLKGSK
jgi:hypothetical protein